MNLDTLALAQLHATAHPSTGSDASAARERLLDLNLIRPAPASLGATYELTTEGIDYLEERACEYQFVSGRTRWFARNEGDSYKPRAWFRCVHPIANGGGVTEFVGDRSTTFSVIDGQRLDFAGVTVFEDEAQWIALVLDSCAARVGCQPFATLQLRGLGR